MAKFENVQGISRISFNQNVQCFCPLGNDWYTNQLTIEMEVGNIVPDYCDVDDFIRSISGQSLIIEDVISKVYDYFIDTYSPLSLRVESYVDDAKHLPVTVVKESN